VDLFQLLVEYLVTLRQAAMPPGGGFRVQDGRRPWKMTLVARVPVCSVALDTGTDSE
jgi:hypothetical protein